MADESPDPMFRNAAAAYRSAGQLQRPPAVPQVVRVVETPTPAPEPTAAVPAALPSAAAPHALPSTPASTNAAPAPLSASGISLMITNAQKESLRRLGVSEAEIRDMTPAEAHRRLGLSVR